MRPVHRFEVALLGIMLTWTLLQPAPARSTPAPQASVGSFDQELLQAAAQLDAAAAQARSRHHTKARIPRIAFQQPPGMSSGTAPSVNVWVSDELRRIRAEKRARTQAHDLENLAAALRHAAGQQGEPAPSRDAAAAAAAILAQKAYQTGGTGPAPPPHQSILEKILLWLGERLSDLFRIVFGATAKIPAIGAIVAVLYIALIAAVAAYLIFLLVSLLVRRRRHIPADEGTPLPQTVEPDALYELGAAAAARGQYAQAVALLFQACLHVLDRSGKLPYDASLTAGEYRRAVRRSLAAASPPFDAIAKTFVLAAFAQRPISKEEFMAADDAYRSLQPLVAA